MPASPETSASPIQLRPVLRRADFLRVTRCGRRVETDYFLVFRQERSEGDAVRLGITVTRKVGNAVRRNRIKRLVRAWFQVRRREIAPCDLVLIAKRELPPRPQLALLARDLDAGLALVGRSAPWSA